MTEEDRKKVVRGAEGKHGLTEKGRGLGENSWTLRGGWSLNFVFPVTLRKAKESPKPACKHE